MDSFVSWITCLKKIWIRPSSNQLESPTVTVPKPLAETVASFVTSYVIGTQPLLKWSTSNFISKCPSTLPDNTFGTAPPV